MEPGRSRDLVLFGEPAYSTFEVAARYAGARPRGRPLGPAERYLLEPEDFGPDVLSRAGIVFLNYPHNPSGQVLPAELFRRWVAARDEFGFVLVSDECYCDVWFEEPPHSLVEFGDRTTTGTPLFPFNDP